MAALAGRLLRALRRDRGLPPGMLARKLARGALSLATAPVYLRACDEVGAGVRTMGFAPAIENAGRIVLRDAVQLLGDFARVHLHTEPGGTISIGEGAIVSYGASLSAARLVEIGPHAFVAWRSVLHDHEPGAPGRARPIRIGEGAWLAGGVRVLPGCTVGARSVVGAGSVVAEDVPPGVVAAGVPARVLRPIAGADARSRAEGEEPPPGPGRPLVVDLALPLARAALRAGAALCDGDRRSVAGLAAVLRLRACDEVGAGTRVEGSPAIENFGRIVLGARVRLCSRPEKTHLATGSRGELLVGDDVSIGPGSGLCAHARVAVGDGARIGARCMLIDTDFHGLEDRSFHPRPRPIVIGRGATLGDGVIVLRGSVVGDGAVVEPGSVVTGGNVPPGCRVAGVPARPV